MMRAIVIAVFAGACGGFLVAASCGAEGASDDARTYGKTVIKVVDGQRFQLPEDMPLQSKNNIIAPMPIEQYIAMKFERLEERLQRIEADVAALKKKDKMLMRDTRVTKDDIEVIKKASESIVEGVKGK